MNLRKVATRFNTVFLLTIAFIMSSQIETFAKRFNDNFCLFGNTCVVENPVYVNVYWDTSLSQWDADTASTPTLAHKRIDAITRAIIESDYMNDLWIDYFVLNSPGYPLDSLAVPCGSPPPDVNTALSTVSDAISCVLAARPDLNNDNTIINLFLPPQTVNKDTQIVVQQEYVEIPELIPGFCNVQPDGTHHAAQHDKYNTPVRVTFVPTVSACSANFAALISNLTHEMVEAATDPNPSSPTGWKDALVGGDEIADVCEKIPSTSFLSVGLLPEYWSNSDNACTTGVSKTAPAITKVTVCGTGKDMTITLFGTIGPEPWDLASGVFNGRSLYVNATVSGTDNWGAGNLLAIPPDSVNFKQIIWFADKVILWGFDGGYGTSGHVVSPDDLISVTLSSAANGVSAVTTVKAPGPSLVAVVDPEFVAAGSSIDIPGSVEDASGCGVARTQVQFSDPSGFSQTVTSSDDGAFSLHYVAPSIAGKILLTSNAATLTQSSTVIVNPVLNGLSRHVGSVSGGQQVALTGSGFDASTLIDFVARNYGFLGMGPPIAYQAQIQQSAASLVLLTTPKSPFPGDGSGIATITASVNGVEAPNELTYQYVVPGKPVGTTTADLCGPMKSFEANVTAYNPDGSIIPAVIDLSAVAPLFTVKGQPSTTYSMPSGGSVTIANVSAPYDFTATNTNGNIVANIAFDCTPTLPSPEPIPLFTFGPNCAGDCGGPQGQPVVWTFGDPARAVASVFMVGRTAAELKQSYEVRGVSVGEFSLMLRSSTVEVDGKRQQASDVAFIAQPIVIRRARESSSVSTAIPESGTVSFTVGSRIRPQIVHLETTGSDAVWTPVPASTFNIETGVVRLSGPNRSVCGHCPKGGSALARTTSEL